MGEVGRVEMVFFTKLEISVSHSFCWVFVGLVYLEKSSLYAGFGCHCFWDLYVVQESK